ncbi:hypothetical protein LX32DRAFT_220639 [Colletotrichum zoysiae]|uniref:Uncharacterized protein n=1 Tax=Colletotrichum zoysiae TaxID=1216348 RepID=A0AAD9H556_9PEZI|nr:hypothetical protein LX32DRAFT_220639 [Colletotrichum zoysiae]
MDVCIGSTLFSLFPPPSLGNYATNKTFGSDSPVRGLLGGACATEAERKPTSTLCHPHMHQNSSSPPLHTDPLHSLQAAPPHARVDLPDSITMGQDDVPPFLRRENNLQATRPEIASLLPSPFRPLLSAVRGLRASVIARPNQASRHDSHMSSFRTKRCDRSQPDRYHRYGWDYRQTNTPLSTHRPPPQRTKPNRPPKPPTHF